MLAIEEVQTPLLAPPPIRFDFSNESVSFNFGLLKEIDLDLEKVLGKH